MPHVCNHRSIQILYSINRFQLLTFHKPRIARLRTCRRKRDIKYNSDNISFMLSNPLRFLIVIHFILSIAQLALLTIIKGERLD